MMDNLVALGRYGATSALVTRDGEILERAQNILLLFRPAWADEPMLQRPDVRIFDLAELWAFVKAGQNAPPTLMGMLKKSPNSAEESACYLYELLNHLIEEAHTKAAEIAPFLNWLSTSDPLYRWPWLEVLMPHATEPSSIDITDIIKKIDKWSIITNKPPQSDPVELAFRTGQSLYYKGLNDFIATDNDTKTLLAIGGTGVGKTRAYLAAAMHGPGQVWVSTFTRALQQQVQREAAIHLNLPAHIRKGRDNYVCLKLVKEAWDRAPHWADGRLRVGLATLFRWLDVTEDGDMTGGSFSGWLLTLFGPMVTADMTDRRKECSYNGCVFFQQCFAERARAWSLDAPLVIANHAVVANLLIRGQTAMPQILIMDEAHHVEHVADDVLTGGVSLVSATELGRLLMGVPAENRRKGRRGFLETLAETMPDTDRALIQTAAKLAELLPIANGLDRIRSGQSTGLLEMWLGALWRIINQEVSNRDTASSYDWDIPRTNVPAPDQALVKAVTALLDALQTILYRLEYYDREATIADGMPAYDPKRDVLQNCLLPLRLWLTQWDQLSQDLDPTHIEWAAIKREDGQVRDIGLYRAWQDPLSIWKTMTESRLDATVYTTATPTKALLELPNTDHIQVNSPFDYSVQSLVLVITDIDGANEREMAKAISALMGQTGGGAMAIFTAIARLRRVHDLMIPLCEQQDLHLLAQHIDAMDVATLVDIFRTEPRCALLGTDAVRDGVDIPGEALRLLIFDRVPWPRPDILHKARRTAHGGRHYDEDLVRLKLKQAFGRLIRTETDKGVFVMLDSKLPSRLYDAFPAGVRIERVTITEAVEILGDFFADTTGILAA